MSIISKIRFSKVVRPLKTTFATSLGSKNFATSVIVTVTLADGSCGIGEVPTSFVLKHETAQAIGKTIRQAKSLIEGSPIDEYAGITSHLRQKFPDMHMTVSGIEVALFRAWLATRGQTEHAFWGSKKHKIATDITIPFVPEVKSLATWLGMAIKTGFSQYKVKVSGKVDIDFKFVTEIHDQLKAAGQEFVIRLDGNQGFTEESALLLVDKLLKRGIAIELFEQPLLSDDYQGLKNLMPRSQVPVIVDETVFSVENAKHVIDEKLAHGINIKIAKSGITESAQIMRLAKKAGLKLMIGCMTETMVGLSAALNMAAGTGGFDYIDLDAIHFLHHGSRFGSITISDKYYVIE